MPAQQGAVALISAVPQIASQGKIFYGNTILCAKVFFCYAERYCEKTSVQKSGEHTDIHSSLHLQESISIALQCQPAVISQMTSCCSGMASRITSDTPMTGIIPQCISEEGNIFSVA
jgi:hypothetical protein